jgi:hypothetical protein
LRTNFLPLDAKPSSWLTSSKTVEARTDIPALTRVDTGVPSALQLATMAICLFLVPSQLSESELGNLYNCLK